MSRLAQTERHALCDLALELGPDEPTLCGDWTVKDLVVHLLVREGSPSAAGILVKPLSRLTEATSRRLARRDLSELVERLRLGPPVYSPLALPAIDRAVNTIEFFVHHEDLRRSRPNWQPRVLGERAEAALWRLVRVTGKGLVRSAPVGVAIERTDTGDRAVLRSAPTTVVVRGLPSELVLFVYGRQPQSKVELVGDDAARAALVGTSSLGI